MKLTVVIPAFNEEQAILSVLEGLNPICPEYVQEIIVVDDGSTDETGRIAEAAGATVIRHHQNVGYGAALKTGIRAVKTEWVLTMDADGQHRADQILSLCNVADSNDMIVGQRIDRTKSPTWRMPGKWLLERLANYLTGYKIPDLNSGLRLIRNDVVKKYLHLCPSGFSFTTTISMALLDRGYNVCYVPIQIEKRVGRSTVTLKTGLDTLILILRVACLFNPLKVFIPASLIIGAIGIFWGIPYALMGRGISVGSMLAIVTSTLFFALGLICDQISQLRLERYE